MTKTINMDDFYVQKTPCLSEKKPYKCTSSSCFWGKSAYNWSRLVRNRRIEWYSYGF